MASRYKVRVRELIRESGELSCYALTTYRNPDIEVRVDPSDVKPIDLVQCPKSLDREEFRRLNSILNRANTILNEDDDE